MKIFLNIPEVKGDATTSGYAGQIECQSVLYRIDTPRDPTTGQLVGKRVHRPVEFVHAWDKASPALGQAMVASTTFPKATFTFVAETPSFGARHLQIELANVRVAAVAQAGVQGGAVFPSDKVELTFTAIDVTFAPPGVAGRKISDTASAP